MGSSQSDGTSLGGQAGLAIGRGPAASRGYPTAPQAGSGPGRSGLKWRKHTGAYRVGSGTPRSGCYPIMPQASSSFWRTAWASMTSFTSLPTSTPPISSAWFHSKPNSRRSMAPLAE